MQTEEGDMCGNVPGAVKSDSVKTRSTGVWVETERIDKSNCCRLGVPYSIRNRKCTVNSIERSRVLRCGRNQSQVHRGRGTCPGGSSSSSSSVPSLRSLLLLLRVSSIDGRSV